MNAKNVLAVFAAVTMSLALTSLAQPVIITQPTNQTVFGGSNVTFSVTVSGTGPFTYHWQFNGTNLPNNIITTLAGNGDSGYEGDGGLADLTSVSSPWGIAVDKAGNVFIADFGNSRVRKVDTHGIIGTFAGNGTNGYSGDGGAATNASLSNPSGLAFDAVGNLYISDYSANCVRKVDTNGIITTFAGGGTNTANGIAATNALITNPFGLAFDAVGNLFIADSGDNLIRKVDTNGIITTVAGGGPNYIEGNGGYATNGFLVYPTGVALDIAGNLYIADCNDDMVRKVDTNGIITAFAGTGSATGSNGDGGPATNAIVFYPRGVAVDALGNVFIADFGDNRVRVVNTNGIISTMVGTGAVGYSGDNGDAKNADFHNLQGLALDASNNILVADLFNNRVRVATHVGRSLRFSNVTTNLTGDYTVVISDSSGSVTSSVAALTVVLPPSISTQPISQLVPISSNVTFSVSCSGTPPLVYQWFFNGDPILGATNSDYPFSVVSTNQEGDYSVIITNDYGSVTSSVAELAVMVVPPRIASQPTSQLVPVGSNATFKVIASGSPPFSYQWFYNSTAMDEQTNSSLSLTDLTTDQAGGYDVLVSSPYGSITSQVATLTVAGLPIFTAQPTDQTILAGGRAEISADVSGIGPLTFQWQLDGSNLPNNLITTIAGNGTGGFAGDGGLAMTGEIYTPYGVTADNAGDVFIADSGNNRIRKVDVNGVMTTVAGNGLARFWGDGGPATNAGLDSPDGVATDSHGDLFIADTLDNRIRKVDTNGIITTVAGDGMAGFSGDGGPATSARLYRPHSVTLDDAGDLFVADSGNNRVRKVDTNGIISTVAGNGMAGFSGDGGSATNANLNSPLGVAVDKAGNLYIADGNNHRIRKVDTYGAITTIAGNGSSVYSGDGGAATNAGLNPYGVTVDAFGDVLIADRNNNRIRQVDPYGIITTVAGTNGFGYLGDGGAATNARLYGPSGVALDSYGRTLIADTSNDRIRRFGMGPTLVLDSASAADAGDYTLVVSSPYGSVTSRVATVTLLSPPAIVNPPADQSAGLDSNAAFTVTASGTEPLSYQWLFNGTNLLGQTDASLNLTNVQWNDAGAYDVIITNDYGSVTSSPVTLTVGRPPQLTGEPTNLIAGSGSSATFSVQVSGDGPFTYQWRHNGTNLPPVVITVAGNGQVGYSGDGGPATNAELSNPCGGLAVDEQGSLYIADYNNNRVRKVNTNGIITTIAGTGTSGNSGNGGPSTNATLFYPEGMTFDQNGNLYISEYGNGDVRKVGTNGIITRVAGTGSVGISGDGNQATNTSLYYVTDVAVGDDGTIYVDEEGHCRIRKVGTNGILTTAAGNTYSVTGGYSGDGGPATNAQLNDPFGIALDASGNLIIADTYNGRIREVDKDEIINTIIGGGSSSQDGQLGTNTQVSFPYSVCVDASNNVFFTSGGSVRKMNADGVVTTVWSGGSASRIALDDLGNVFLFDQPYSRVRKVCSSGLPVLSLQSVNGSASGNYSVVVSSPFGSVTSSNATLMVFTAPVINSIQANADGSVTLDVSSTSNVVSRLYTATNLAPPIVWQPIGTNSAGGSWQFTDTNAPAHPVQFYRATTP